MSLRTFSSKLSGKGGSSKNATVVHTSTLYTCLSSKNETSYTIITSCNYKGSKQV